MTSWVVCSEAGKVNKGRVMKSFLSHDNEFGFCWVSGVFLGYSHAPQSLCLMSYSWCPYRSDWGLGILYFFFLRTEAQGDCGISETAYKPVLWEQHCHFSRETKYWIPLSKFHSLNVMCHPSDIGWPFPNPSSALTCLEQALRDFHMAPFKLSNFLN